MLPPKRIRRRLLCPACSTPGHPAVLGRVATSRKGQTVLYIQSGHGTMVTDAATENEWIIVCDKGHQTLFHGHTVIWKQGLETEAA